VWRRRGFAILAQAHFDFEMADPEMIAVLQGNGIAVADRRVRPVQKDTIGTRVGQQILALGRFDGAVLLGYDPLGIGQHPIVLEPSADGQGARLEKPRAIFLRQQPVEVIDL
jgi:hypothetical protein